MIRTTKHFLRACAFGPCVALAGSSALTLAAATAGDPPIVEDVRLVPSSGEADDRFGESVSTSGDTILVGASLGEATGGPPTSGTAFVYLRAGLVWMEEAQLLPLNPVSFMRFGHAVSLDGDHALIGAPLDHPLGPDSGSAFVFVRSGGIWTEQSKLVAFDGAPDDHFGWSVAIDGERAVIGAYLADAVGVDSGAAYVYRRTGTTWSLEAKLLGADTTVFDGFGAAVAIDGDTLAVGAIFHDHPSAASAGAVYIFQWTGAAWVQEAKLTASDPAVAARLGSSVSLDGNTLVAGAVSAQPQGAAYVFERSGTQWSETAKLTPGVASSSGFGNSVSLRGSALVVGALNASEAGPFSGVAHAFVRCGSTWRDDGRRIGSDSGQLDGFGRSTALGEDLFVAGAVTANGGIGAAYVFVPSSAHADPFCPGDDSGTPCPCNNPSAPGAGEGCRNSSGVGAALLPGGSARASTDDLRMHACGMIPGQAALLFGGQIAVNGGNGLPFGDGLRCVGGDVRRLGVKFSSPAGSATWGPGLVFLGGFGAGDLRYFQVWYRDAVGSVCGTNFNTSSALALTFQP